MRTLSKPSARKANVEDLYEFARERPDLPFSAVVLSRPLDEAIRSRLGDFGGKYLVSAEKRERYQATRMRWHRRSKR